MPNFPSPLLSHSMRISPYRGRPASWKDHGTFNPDSMAPKPKMKKPFGRRRNKILHSSPTFVAQKQKKRSQKLHKK